MKFDWEEKTMKFRKDGKVTEGGAGKGKKRGSEEGWDFADFVVWGGRKLREISRG